MYFANDSRVTNIYKPSDHDRLKKCDFVMTYRGIDISVEVKSLQTATVKLDGEIYKGKVQCDASDRRIVKFSDGSTLQTTCLLAGEFDLLAVNLFAFEKKWRYVFARNKDLPRSQFRKYTPEQREKLLATLFEVSWPPKPPFTADPFPLLDEIVREGNG
jgi:hypothetical protein